MGLVSIQMGSLVRAPKRVANFRARGLLKSPGIPAPLYGMAPRVLMPKEWWNRVRVEALAGNNYCCWACGEDPEYHPLGRQKLEAHETYAINYGEGVMDYRQTTALCVPCHRFIHLGRVAVLVRKGEVTMEAFREVEDWGYKVLRGEHKQFPEEVVVPWEKWRLRVGDMEFLSPGPMGIFGDGGE